VAAAIAHAAGTFYDSSSQSYYRRRDPMSVYRVIDVIGTSPNSWEDAAKEALMTARKSVRNLRVAEVSEFDITVNDAGEVEQYRTKLRVSFKYEVD
jgi:flavin-binding protein dodecin